MLHRRSARRPGAKVEVLLSSSENLLPMLRMLHKLKAKVAPIILDKLGVYGEGTEWQSCGQ